MSEKSEMEALLSEQMQMMAETMKPMHLKIAQALVEGKSQGEAYKAAGGKGKNPFQQGHQLIIKNHHIGQYEKLGKKLLSIQGEQEALATLQEKRKLLWNIAEASAQFKPDGLEEEDAAKWSFNAVAAKTAVSAVAELNKMDGDLAAIKTDNKHSHDYDDMSDEELEREIARMEKEASES